MFSARARPVAELARIDPVVANAGIATYCRAWEITGRVWQDMIDVNLTDVFHTAKVAIPRLIVQGEGGSMVFGSWPTSWCNIASGSIRSIRPMWTP